MNYVNVDLMTKTFMMKLNEIQPSQLYISSEKLSEVMKTFDPAKPELIEPIPIKKLGNAIVFVDGHTRAFAAFLYNISEIPVYLENEELDWDAYRICVEWCRNEGIHTIADLKNRVVPQKDYEILWYRRCEEMQQNLEKRRKKEHIAKALETGKGYKPKSKLNK
jgi:hypothetical protein